jgi:hypothetical protein
MGEEEGVRGGCVNLVVRVTILAGGAVSDVRYVRLGWL